MQNTSPMAVVVGVSADDAGEDATALGAVLAPLFGGQVVAAHVYPAPMDFPSMGSVDAEWSAFVADRAAATVDDARLRLATEWSLGSVATCVEPHRSRARGLAEIAARQAPSVIVLGPAPGGSDGRISVGSVANSLLHGAASAVALAPEGYRETAPDRLTRLVVGFRDTPESHAAVREALRWAAPRGIEVHLLTVVLRATRIVGSRLGRDAERPVLEAIVDSANSAQGSYIAAAGATGLAATVVQGDTAERALARFDFADGDLFVLASSTAGPVQRVFLGDMTHKLLRAAPVPAIVLPRGAGDGAE